MVCYEVSRTGYESVDLVGIPLAVYIPGSIFIIR